MRNIAQLIKIIQTSLQFTPNTTLINVHKISNNNQSSTTKPKNGNTDFNLTPNITNNINKFDTVEAEDTNSQASYEILHQTEIQPSKQKRFSNANYESTNLIKIISIDDRLQPDKIIHCTSHNRFNSFDYFY